MRPRITINRRTGRLHRPAHSELLKPPLIGPDGERRPRPCRREANGLPRSRGRRDESSHPKNSRAGISTFSLLLGSALWGLVFLALWLTVASDEQQGTVQAPQTGQSSDASDSTPDDTAPKSLTIRFPAKELPDFAFPECMGETLSRDSMRGKRWLASFVFTRCVETCPTITRNVSELHRRVAESNPDFRFVTFSVDSSFDTAEVLKKYAETFQADHKRWKFVTGDENQIHDLIRRGFTQYVKPALGAERKPGFEVAHTNRAVLVNENLIPVATYLMTVPEDVVRLRRVIEGKTPFPEPGPGIAVMGQDGVTPAIQLTPVPVTEEPADGSDPADDSQVQDVPKSLDAQSSNTQKDSADPQSQPVATSTGASPTETAVDRNKKIEKTVPRWVGNLPSINASLNSLCTLLLLVGYFAIRGGQRTLHRNLMISAFIVSVVFLGCYLTYHEALYRFTGLRGRAFEGAGGARLLYFSILIPHVILAVFVPIMAIRVFQHAWRQDWANHRRLAKITLPVWLFVSITGVIIYWMLYHWPWKTVA
jgi:protein SCO1/2